MPYTYEDAKREVTEMLEDGESMSCIVIFIHDLCRGRDITWQEGSDLRTLATNYKLDRNQSTGLATF